MARRDGTSKERKLNRITLVHAVDDVAVASHTLTLTSVTRGGNTTPLDRALALDGQGQARLVLTEELIGTLKFDATATDVSGEKTKRTGIFCLQF